MTAALPLPSDWCFDCIDLTPLVPRRARPGKDTTDDDDDVTPATVIDLIFAELCHETDRPIRERINEALRQWRLRRIAARKT